METFGRNGANIDFLPSAQAFHDEVAGFRDRVKQESSKALSNAEGFISEHKTGTAIVVGAAAVVGVLACSGKLGSAESFLSALKISREEPVSYDLTKVAKLAKQAASSDWRERYTTAYSWDSPPELLKSLANDQHVQVRMMIAKHPMTPRATVQSMTVGDDAQVRRAGRFGLERREQMQLQFARDPRATAGILHRIATEPMQALRAREAVALHRGTSPQTLSFLSRDADPEVRAAVALHSATPAKSLSKLSRDESLSVRAIAASHPSLPEKDLARLAKGTDAATRFEVAWSSAATPDLLEGLGRDRNYLVRSGVGRNEQSSPSLLERLSGDRSPVVRESVAQNPNLGKDALQRLSDDEEGLVRIAAKKTLKSRARS